MPGSHVKVPINGREITAYLSRSSTQGPSVIVLQEWWGLVPHIEHVCDRLAAEGFTAMAPDLYHGERANGPDEARKFMMALNFSETEADLMSVIKYLQAKSNNTKVGTVGFCMGGMLSLYTACINQSVGACVDFYGVHPNVKPDLSRLEAPVLGFFGANDHVVPVESVRQLEERLQSLNKNVEFIVYDDADHAFFNDTRPEVYNHQAAIDAWKRMLAFYREHLAD